MERAQLASLSHMLWLALCMLIPTQQHALLLHKDRRPAKAMQDNGEEVKTYDNAWDNPNVIHLNGDINQYISKKRVPGELHYNQLVPFDQYFRKDAQNHFEDLTVDGEEMYHNKGYAMSYPQTPTGGGRAIDILNQHWNDIDEQEALESGMKSNFVNKYKQAYPISTTHDFDTFEPPKDKFPYDVLMMGGLVPDFPAIHPSVGVMSGTHNDLEKGGADYMDPPPDPIPPMPPYLYPPDKPGDFKYTVPVAYQAFYPVNAPPSYPGDNNQCIPVKQLPFVKGLSPMKYMDDYCVPMKYLPYYHPVSWRGMDSPTKPGGGPQQPPAGSGPYFAAPPSPGPQFQLPLPFNHAPRFPAFATRDGKHAPPAGMPPPPPANHPLGHLATMAPPLLPPPMAPPMFPYG